MNRVSYDLEEGELNMTPMIDIVFQLIVFFLLSLKFKTIDRRIDAMLPRTSGLDDGPVQPPLENRIRLKIFRRQGRWRQKAFTLVRVDPGTEFKLPAGWRGRAREPAARLATYDRILRSIQAEIRRRVSMVDGQPEVRCGEIVAPPPMGGSVPHGDVVGLLNAFLAAGITQVRFEGTSPP